MNDWIRLLVKYNGKCFSCGKEISTGQYALWSKSSKAIKHIECKALASATAKNRDSDPNRQLSTEVEDEDDYCFICSRPVADNNSGFEADDSDREKISQATICNRCLEDKNAYQNYQHAFLEKIHRVAKVKL